MMHGTIVIAGSLAQKPRQGGHIWVLLQYLLGFKRLGWRVLFLDQLECGMCRGVDGQPCSLDQSLNLRYFLDVMRKFGLTEEFSLICDGGRRFIGVQREEVLELTRHAAFLLNVMGYLSNEEIVGSARRRVFLDIDPGFGQMWRELHLADVFRGHDLYVTIGENIGRRDCTIPSCGLSWITTRQPVVLDHWPAAEDGGQGITSVASWRGAYSPVRYQGMTYGLRVHEFRKFASLPRLCKRPLQIALDIHPAEVEDLALLETNGWVLVDPVAVAGDPWSYQAYIHGSRAEFTVAKNMYVQTNSGWFSDRSICYLASGRPVVAQDTGLAGIYPTGEGLLTFRTLEEARACMEALEHDYGRHARAACELAEEYFDSDKVLGRLLGRLGVA